MYIRSVRLADLLLFGRLRQQILRLDLPAALVTSLSPFSAALKGWLPVASGVRTFVLREQQPRAFIQVAARGHRWEVVCLGGRTPDETCQADNHPWLLLLNYVAMVAPRRRVTRLLAKLPETAPGRACFEQAGYQTYGQELIFQKVYTAEDRVPLDEIDLRPQRASDAWLIHRLYFQVTPRPVQDAEAHTSNHWELRRPRPGGLRQQGWLLEEAAETVVYARTLSRGHVHMVEWLYHPAQRDLLPALVRQTLAQLPAVPGDRIYACVREYQAEAEAALMEAGFVSSGGQALMVKYLAIRVAARERVFMPLSRAKARGVPSLLRRASGTSNEQ